jgi:hypothetical protein
MTAVIAKAVDAGYRFVIILSGLSNSLRQQTRERMENDLVCLETIRTLGILGRLLKPTPVFLSLSQLKRSGPFRGSEKNGTVLNRLLVSQGRTDPSILKTLPALIIDDECDQASVNNSGFLNRMTKINAQIRKLIQLLPKVSYVGYTATPFANVLIDPRYDVTSSTPDDLYPKDFVFQLPDRTDISAGKTFGRDHSMQMSSSAVEVLDLIRTVPDGEVVRLRPGKRFSV